MTEQPTGWDINWQYRRQYLLKHVLLADTLLMVQYQRPHYLVHYRSEEYGASMARVHEFEWQELLDDNPYLEDILNTKPYEDLPDKPTRVPINAELAQVVEQPLLPSVAPDITELQDKAPFLAEMAASLGEVVATYLPEVVPAAAPVLVAPTPLPIVELAPQLAPSVAVADAAWPVLEQQFNWGTYEKTPEADVLLKREPTYNYVAENDSDTNQDATLIGTILHRGIADIKYWRTPYPEGWRGAPKENWYLMRNEDVLSTATGWFIGRLLGVVLMHYDNVDEPRPNRLALMLETEGGSDSQFTPEVVLSLVEDEWPRVTRTARDRMELPLRLLKQVLRCSRMQLPTVSGTKKDTSITEWYNLVDGCRRICWYMNVTQPSGYAFVGSMLRGQKTFFSRQESALLASLLNYTNKRVR